MLFMEKRRAGQHALWGDVDVPLHPPPSPYDVVVVVVSRRRFIRQVFVGCAE